MKLQYFKKHLVKLIIGMYSVLVVFLLFTDPRSLPVYILVVPIVWLFACISLTMFVLLSKMYKTGDAHDRKNLIYAMAFSGLICTILLLRSVNQLNGRDLLLVIVFLVLATFYASKLRISSKA